MKLAFRIALVVPLVILAVSFLQYVQISVSDEARMAYEENRRHSPLQGAIQIRFCIKDQNGSPAPHYRFNAVVYSVRWFWRVFPATKNAVRYYALETDDSGTVKFMPARPGYGVVACEVDNSQFRALLDDSGAPRWPAIHLSRDGSPPPPEHPWAPPVHGALWLSTHTSVLQDVILDVVRHDPPEPLITISGLVQRVTINSEPDAPEDLVIPIRLSPADASLSAFALNLKMTVLGAKAYALAVKRSNSASGQSLPFPCLRLVLEAGPGVGLQLSRATTDNAPAAPTAGYTSTVSVVIAKEMPPCFVRKESPLTYYRLDGWVVIMGDIIQPNLGGVFNPSQ